MKIFFQEHSRIKEVEVTSVNAFGGANIPHLQVLKSAAGFYIGTLCKEDWSPNGEEYWGPYSRDSAGYYSTREQAEYHLKNGSYPVRF